MTVSDGVSPSPKGGGTEPARPSSKSGSGHIAPARSGASDRLTLRQPNKDGAGGDKLTPKDATTFY